MPGCGMKKGPDGFMRGYRLSTWNYTGCWVVSITVYQTVHIPAQIDRVKNVGVRGWVEGVRPEDGPLYSMDRIERIKGIKGTKASKLAQGGGRRVGK